MQIADKLLLVTVMNIHVLNFGPRILQDNRKRLPVGAPREVFLNIPWFLCHVNTETTAAAGPFGFKASRSLVPHRAFCRFNRGSWEGGGGGASSFGPFMS